MHLKEAGKNGLRPDILLRRNHPFYYDCGCGISIYHGLIFQISDKSICN
jgi:hypothetical protein